MKYLAVLGRQPELSLAELEALGFVILAVAQKEMTMVVEIEGEEVDIDRLGGTLKLAVPLEKKPEEWLYGLPAGKITFGISDYSVEATAKTAVTESLRLKRKLVQQGRSVRIVENKTGILSSATVLHNGLSGKNPRKVELIKLEDEWFRVVGVQDIDAYARRDQARPARDAKVGMLPPKLAQILINLCGRLPQGARILDPFCGTGVLLQEALLMGYQAYGTDKAERMVDYTKRNLQWIFDKVSPMPSFDVQIGDATSYKWQPPIGAVACEGYLGKPFAQTPSEMEIKEQKQECSAIILGFLRNLVAQIAPDTPVVIAAPAWLRANGRYQRLENLDEIGDLGYNVSNRSREGLFYFRSGQVVARDIIILRKK